MLNKLDWFFFYWIIRLVDECNVGDVIYLKFRKENIWYYILCILKCI